MWDPCLSTYVEWALYDLIGIVGARCGDGIGRVAGYHKMKEQEAAGYTWFYKQCTSERACLKLQYDSEQRRPSLYAYMGMGVEGQEQSVAGIVIRSARFDLIAELISTIVRLGGRAPAFDDHNVLNQANKEPDDVAARFRPAMKAKHCKINDHAGDPLRQVFTLSDSDSD